MKTFFRIVERGAHFHLDLELESKKTEARDLTLQVAIFLHKNKPT